LHTLVLLRNGYLASGNDNGTIQLWNVETGSLISSVQAHTDVVTSLAITNNGFLISGSKDEFIKIWNYTSGILILKSNLTNITSQINCVAVNRENTLFVGYSNGKILFYNNIDTNLTYVGQLNYTESRVLSLFFNNDQVLLSGHENSQLNIWNVTANQLIISINCSSSVNAIYSFANYIATGTSDGFVQDFLIQNSISSIQSLNNFYNINISIPVSSIQLNSITSNTFVGLNDGSINIYGISGYVGKLSLHNETVSSIIEIDSYRIASASLDKSFIIWSNLFNFQLNY
jgi:WD40 repeat protein